MYSSFSSYDAMTQNQHSDSPLHLAIQANDIESARNLIATNCNANAQNNHGDTPLHYAANLGNYEMVKLLLMGAHADVKIRNNSNMLPFHNAVSKRHVDIVQLLIASGNASDVDERPYGSYAPIYTAIDQKDLTMVRVLITEGKADINAEASRFYRYNGLFMAIDDKNLAMVKLLVTEGKANLQGTCRATSKTPLEFAYNKGNLEIFRFLLSELKEQNYNYNDEIFRILDTAIRFEQVNYLRIIMEVLGSNILSISSPFTVFTPIHMAAQNERDTILRLFVTEGNANVLTLTQYGDIPLANAANYARLDSVKYLLSIPGVSTHPRAGFSLAVNGNATLQRAAQLGDLELVNRLLEYPEVVANVTADDNLALRAAQNNGHDAIVARLMQITAVRDLAVNMPELNLAAVAQDPENSMDDLDPTELGLVAAVKRHYKHVYESLGQDVILKNFTENLEKQYKKTPAKDAEGLELPLGPYNETIAQLPYYTHASHTAWRYFLRPNLWMRPDMPCTNAVAGGRAAEMFAQSRENLAYFWLAVSSKDYIPLEGFTRKSIIQGFVREIAYINRAHNYDATKVDDLGPDQPSCALGVDKRLMQSLLGHPLTEKPEARALSATIFMNKFRESLLSPNDRFPNNFYQSLNNLSLEQLNALQTGMDNEVGEEMEPLSDELTAIFSLLSPQEVDAFVEDCKIWFTPERITNLPVNWLMHNYVSYEQFAKALSLNLKRHFYSEIYFIVDGLIKAKTPQAVPALTFSNNNADTESNNKNSDNDDSGPSNKRRRLDP